MDDKNKEIYEFIAKSKDGPANQFVHEAVIEIESIDPHGLTKILNQIKDVMQSEKEEE